MVTEFDFRQANLPVGETGAPSIRNARKTLSGSIVGVQTILPPPMRWVAPNLFRIRVLVGSSWHAIATGREVLRLPGI